MADAFYLVLPPKAHAFLTRSWSFSAKDFEGPVHPRVLAYAKLSTCTGQIATAIYLCTRDRNRWNFK